MQCAGYIIEKETGKKILLLVRSHETYRSLKLRMTGNDGSHFSDEESCLNMIENKDILEDLKNGKVINC